MRKAGPGASLRPTGMSAGCRRAHWRRPARRRPTRLQHCALLCSPGRRSSCRRSRRCRSAQHSPSRACTNAWRSPRRAAMCRRRILRRSTRMKPISSRSRSVSSACLICGAARPHSASTAPVWCRSRLRPAAFPARATAICRKRRSARLSRRLALIPISSAAISCSGRATSPLCATRRGYCTPTHSTWLSSSSRSPRPSRIRDAGSEVTRVRRIAR